jgi:4-alpha-glucanotransferase
MMKSRARTDDLHQLAALYGVQTSYLGADKATHASDDDVVTSVLRALGAPLSGAKDVASALRERRLALAQQVIEPVIALRLGVSRSFTITLPESVAAGDAWLSLELEDGSAKRERLSTYAHTSRPSEVERQRFYEYRIDFDDDLRWSVPFGYHSLRLDFTGSPTSLSASSLIISAPPCPVAPRGWGVFIPLHAIRGDRDWGVGSYSDLDALGEWIGAMGGSFLGGLPLYPTFPGPPADPSPYRPVSRLAYNELFVDPEALPELSQSAEARERFNSSGVQARIDALRRSTVVDYDGVASLRREILQPMASALIESTGSRRREFDVFAAKRPELVAYANFRAASERPGQQNVGASERPAVDDKDPLSMYHLYCQFAACEQLERAAATLPLYADLPVGVHPEGFDPYWSPRSFVTGVNVGAPPDLFFSEGQDWGFAPLQPEKIREDGYSYFIAVLARALRHASYLRVDHVMGLDRLYVIPSGADARHGAYVSYRAEEMHALVSLEAYRAGSVVIGEDLGTVPDELHERMSGEGMLRSWVFEFESTLDDPLPELPADALATLATHDTPRFATYLWGGDIDEAEKTGRYSHAGAEERRDERTHYREALVRALDIPELAEPQLTAETRRRCLAHLSASAVELLMIDLEELWDEAEPQNRPGTSTGNWRRRAALTVEEVRTNSEIRNDLEHVNRRRQRHVPS